MEQWSATPISRETSPRSPPRARPREVDRHAVAADESYDRAVSKRVRSNRGQAARLLTSPKKKAATERALAIATHLRERGDWSLTSASVSRGWTVEIDGDRCRVESVVSAFLEGPRAPGFVFNVTIRSARGTRAIREGILTTPWLQDLEGRLGQSYVSDDTRPERFSLVRVLRGTSDPSTVLAELRHIAAAVEGSPLGRREIRARSPRAKESKRPTDDMWKIIDALGPTAGVSARLHKTANLRCSTTDAHGTSRSASSCSWRARRTVRDSSGP
jgi:hypothetical protein